jgi:hypothetical protein
MPYLLDSNVFIEAKNRHYSFEVCPAFWDWIDWEHTNCKIYSIAKVKDELTQGNDELAQWAEKRGSDFFLPLTETDRKSLDALSKWANESNYEKQAISKFLDLADYCLVAQGHSHHLEVVTHETSSNSPSGKKIKIPDACKAMEVQSLNPYEMLGREKAKFILDRARDTNTQNSMSKFSPLSKNPSRQTGFPGFEKYR